MRNPFAKPKLKCSFCNAPEDEIRRDGLSLIAIKNKPDVAICSECVKLAKRDKDEQLNKPERNVVIWLGDGPDEAA